MEVILNILIYIVGGWLFLFIFGTSFMSIAFAAMAYFRYHWSGIHSDYIETVFYRSSRGKLTPPPNKLKAVALLVVPIVLLLTIVV